MEKLALQLPGFNIISSPTGFGTTPGIPLTDLGSVISGTLEIVFYIAGFLLFFWLLWGVFKYLTAEGSKEHLKNARNHMRWALVGFIVVILAFLLSQYAQRLIPQQQVPLTNLTGNRGDLISVILDTIFGEEKGCAFSGNCPLQPSSVPILLSDFYSLSPLTDTNGEPKSFLADCTGNCKKSDPKAQIPWVYHQSQVSVDEYDTQCPEDTPNSVSSSACGPTSLAMIAEAFNGEEIVNGQPTHQTANNLTRLFLSTKPPLMNCEVGTLSENVADYASLSNVETTDQTLQVRITDFNENSSFDNLESYWRTWGFPIWTRDYFVVVQPDNSLKKYAHYVTIAGVSNNYVWVADPLGPDGQYILRIPKDTFINTYYRNGYWEIMPMPGSKAYEPPD